MAFVLRFNITHHADNAILAAVCSRLQPFAVPSLTFSHMCCFPLAFSAGPNYVSPGLAGYKRQSSSSAMVRRCYIMQSNAAAFDEDQTSASLAASSSIVSPQAPEAEIRVVKLTEDIMSLRCCSRQKLKFEIEYSLKRGTTDNSYILKTNGCITLLDLPDERFSREYIHTLASLIDLTKIRFLVLGHFSPNRTESLIALANSVPHEVLPIRIYCSNPAAQQLDSTLPKGLLEETFSIYIVRPGDSLKLEEGRNLQFILTPTPRWPDGMCSYDSASQLLFTNKLFSAHVHADDDFDVGGWDVYGPDWRFYYDCMLAPVAKQVEAVLQKLPLVPRSVMPSYSWKKGADVLKADLTYILSSVRSGLSLPMEKASAASKSFDSSIGLVVSMLCPMHGPTIRITITELLREYRAWTREKLRQNEEASVAVIYASAYGNTAALAQAISRGISKSGVGVECLNTEQSTSEEVVYLVQRCSGFVIGSPTLAGHMPTPIQTALGIILKDTDAKEKPCGVFGSFGWSGEAVDEIEQRLKSGGFSFAFPTVRCKFKPTESMLQLCEESGTDLGQAVKRSQMRKQKRAAPRSIVASSVEQAVGRVVGSLCVLSAKSGDAESAMLASWVSQASFVPPGLTIAVAKDRAVENLILPGGRFVLNVLGEGKTTAIVKQLLKSFKPGEARFGDLQTQAADNEGRILADAIAWMECTVATRLEAGDHWVLYAVVDNGKLQDDKTFTAMHYRKTGSKY